MDTFLACGCREQGSPSAPFVSGDASPPAAAGTLASSADRRALSALAALAARPTEALALSMHAPFCHVRCLCCARTVLAAQPGAVIADHVDGLAEEIALLARHIGGTREVLAWHLGGGTADELSQAQLARLVQAVQDCWSLPAEAELSLDADPRQLGETGLLGWRALGFRELRLRVFDLDDQVQQAIGRHHSTALVDDVCDCARRSGFECIEIDLVAGLPRQTAARWAHTLDAVVGLAPDRVGLRFYRHRPQTAPVQCGIDADSLPDAQACAGLAELAAQRLGEAGYRRVHAGCYVLEGDPLAAAAAQGRLRRSPVGCSAAAVGAVLAVGPGAIGELDGCVLGNEPDPARWRAAVRAGRLPVVEFRSH